MKNLRRSRAVLGGSMTALLAVWQMCSPMNLPATLLYWDINQGTANSGSSGTGAWDGALLNWNDNSTGTGGTPQAGTTGADDLFFSSGTGLLSGTITVSAGRVANSITFEETGVYTLNGGDITLSGVNGLNFSNTTGANIINTALILGGSTAFTNSDNSTQTLNGGVTGTGNLTLTNNSTGAFTLATGAINNIGTITHTGSSSGTATISAAIGSNVTEVIQNSANSQLVLSNGTNTFSTLTIKSGTVQGSQNTVGQTTSLGTGTVTLGDSIGSASATLIAQGTQPNFANPIILGLTSGTLTIRNANTGTVANFTGGITGNNNLTIITGATGTAGINFTTSAINNTGTITHATTVATGALTISGGIGSNVTGVIQNSATAQFNLSGTNTYNGATSINAGTFALTGGGSLAGSAVSAIASTTFLVSGNSTLGTSGSSSVTIAGGGIFSLVGGTTSTLTINNVSSGATVLTLADASASQLNMEVGATADQINLGSGLKALIGAGGVTVNITSIGALSGTPQTLISASGGGLNTGGGFTLNAVSGNFGGYTLALNNTGALLQLTETANVTPAAAYWGGAVNSVWNGFSGGNANNSNWLNAPAGTDTNAAPGATTNVFMTADTANNLTTTLGQNFEINSLTFTGTGTAGTAAVSIGGSPSTLTINATNANGNTAGVGITKLTGSGADTISAPVILGGNQSWTNNASTLLTVSGGVTGTANLTLNATSTGGITLQTGSVNHTGTIANTGTGAGTATISAIIGSNVTSVTQTGVSPFTISSAFTLNATNKTLTSTGIGLFTFSGGITGTQDLTLNANNTGGITLSTASVNNTGTITNSGIGSGMTTISALIGANVTGIIQNSSTSELRLTAANTAAYTNGFTVKAGTLTAATSLTPFGATTNVITLGDSVVNLASTLNVNLPNTSPVGNAIVLASGVSATLTVSSPNIGSQATITGGVTGNNNLVLSATGANTAGGLRFTNANAVNNTGTVTSNGTGTGTTTIDLLGPNVTSVTQAGASPFVIASPFALSATNKTLVSTGSGLFTLSGGITGAQNLTINANSTGGITLSTNLINPAGTITNSGTGTGTATISGGVSANVTAITENSATSALTISGTGITVNAGGTTLTNSNSSGSSLLTVSGGVTGTGNLILNNNSAITNGITFSTNGINNTGTVTNSGTGTGTETIGVVIGANVTGLIQNSATSQLTLTGANLYAGPTSVTAGTLLLSGTNGAINNSSGISINGSTARFVQIATPAVAPVVTLTQGTLDGTTTVNTVNVANSSGTIVTAGNGGAGTLTIGSLTFSGTSNVNLAATGAAMSTTLATTTLTTNVAGNVVINLTNSGLWSNITYNLISYGSLAGNGFGSFALGTVSGLNPRQSASLTNPIGFVALSITGDTPVWTGLVDSRWTTTAIASPKNWKLFTGGTETDFLTNDNVLFDDSAAGTTTVNISDANVAPSATTFNNSTKNYTLGSTGGFGISTGSLTKSGTGILTMNTANNSYTGATSVDGGILRLSTAQTLTGALNFGSTNNITTAGTLEVKENASYGSMLVQTNSGTNTSNISIDATKTLTINGNVLIGTGFGLTTTTTLFNVAGAGTMMVNNAVSGASFRVGGYTGSTAGQGNRADANFSGLTTLNINLNTTNGVMAVSNNTSANTGGRYSTMTLAATTNITAKTLSVGDGGAYGGTAGQINALKLGSIVTNINVDTFNVGTGSRDFGSVTFNTGTGSIVVRNAAGTGRTAFNMGTTGGATGVASSTNTNTFDVTGHSADLLFGAVAIGTQATRGDVLTNVFAFDTGTLDMTSLTMSVKTGIPLAGTHVVNSTVNLGGGTVIIGTIAQMGQTITATNVANATINVTGGSVSIGTGSGTAITMASADTGTTATALLSLTGGTTTLTGNIVKTGGLGTTSATVTLNGGTLDMSGRNIGDATNLITFNAQSGTLKNLAELNGGGVLSKTTTGTLILEGTNTYTGATTVSAGNLQVGRVSSGTTGAGSTITVNGSGAILSGTGTVLGATTVTQGTIRSGDTGGADIGTLNLQGGLTFNPAGATTVAEFTINGTTISNETGDLINVTGVLTLNNNSNFVVTNGGSWTPTVGQSWTLLNWTSLVPGTWSAGTNLRTGNNGAGNEGNLDLVDITGTGVWDISQFTTNGTISIAAIPEPGRMLLLMFGLMALCFRRQRTSRTAIQGA